MPLFVALLRAGTTSQWRDDLAVVRGLGFAPVGTEGMLSAVLTQLFSLLPLGGRVLRASLVSACALALASTLLYLLILRLLSPEGRSRLAAALALAGALAASLSTPWQLEGTVAGGGALASGLVLAGLAATRARPLPKAWLLQGTLVGAAATENHFMALALIGALGARALASGKTPSLRGALVGGAAAGAVFAAGLGSVVARRLSGRSWLDLGREGSSARIIWESVRGEHLSVAAPWLEDVGAVALALGLLGAGFGLAARRRRAHALPLAFFVLLLVCSGAADGGRYAEGLAALRLLAVGSLAAFAALGALTALELLREARMPFARPAITLSVALAYALVFMTHEDSSLVADRSAHNAGHTWTEEIFDQLPPESLVLLRSEALAWHLFAARAARADRPDLVVVPLTRLQDASLAGRLLDTEPALLPLLREMLVSGRPTEYALSSLADARPLFVEFDPKWDRRLASHLVPGTFWMRFSPHPLGSSDRSVAIDGARASFERVLASADHPGYRDATTLAVLGAQASEQALVLAALGDRAGLAHALDNLARVEPPGTGTPRVAEELRIRAEAVPKGPLDVSDLLR